MDPFITGSAFPPSLDGRPILVLLTVMAFWVGTLLCLQWLYTLIEELVEDPAPFRHPLTAYRAIKILFLLSAMITAVPRMALLMAWKILPAYWREALALGTWITYIAWAALLASAWWVDRMSVPMMRYQLRRLPAPEVAATLTTKKARGFLIFGLIFGVAFATTYVRLDARAQHPLLFQRR